MYHIRFLKVPYLSRQSSPSKKGLYISSTANGVVKPKNFHQRKHSSAVLLHAVVTLTTDLGESFFYGEVNVRLSLYQDNKDNYESILCTKTKKWIPGLRALPFEISISPNLLEELADLKNVKHLFVKAEAIIDSTFKDLINDMDESKTSDCRIVFLPIASCNFNISKTKYSSTIDWSIKYKNDDVRYVIRHLSIGHKKLDLLEQTGENIERHLWDCGVFLVDHLVRQSRTTMDFLKSLLPDRELSNKCPLQIIELGSGCGTVGIALSIIFPTSKILLTDLESAEDICKRNIALNHSKLRARDTSVSFLAFDWKYETNPPHVNDMVFNTTWDIIISCDCTYNVDSFEMLTGVLTMMTTPQSKFLLVHKERHESEKLIFELLQTRNKMFIEKSHQLAVNARADIWSLA
ncbi:putative methyltransferase-domain-containing protein [Dipodascopsis uninucleata]